MDISDIEYSYQFLLDPQSFCKNKRAVIQSDKPVYKVGETAYITIYFYDLLKKEPLSKCQDNKYFNLEVLDGDDKNVEYINREFNEEEDKKIKDYSSFTVELKISNKFKGGVYKIKF